jgi:hypothetical protein
MEQILTNYLETRIITNPFVAKLTFAFRCAVFAAHHYKGTTYPTLAKAFDISEQTAAKICRSKNSRLYHNVYNEFDRLGIERMWNQYVRDTGVLARIDNAEFQRKLGTMAPAEHYVASGPGRYWLKNYEGEKVEVAIKPYEAIKADIPAIIDDKFRHGIWFKHPQTGWTFEEQPFETIEEALRYFAEFPPIWDK